jgi:C4-dicarboxylate-binding protein DctP
MVVPGTWHVSKFVPEVALFLLPEFYGRDASFVHAVSDGSTGAIIRERIESSLDVVVPGGWFDLGPAHTFFVGRRVRQYEDMAGLVVRVAGGRGNELRIAELGAEPLSVAWNDLPQYLVSRRVDGLLTTYETVRSGELWRFGVSHVLEDSQFFAQYVPMIRGAFWDRLGEEERSLIRSVWSETVRAQRPAAAWAQEQAREDVRARGVQIDRLTEHQLESVRRTLLERQHAIARETGVPQELVDSLYDR